MRHHVGKTKLSRDMDHRKALLKNLAESLITNEKVKTTHAKAKFVQPYAENLITKAVKANNSKDKVIKFNTLKELRNAIFTDEAVKKLMDDLAPRYKDTKGGYTKITKMGNRDGDNSSVSRIELVGGETKKAPKVKEAVEVKTEEIAEKKEEVTEAKKLKSKRVKKEE